MATLDDHPHVVEDVRAGRPFLLTRRPLRSLVRRGSSVLALAVLDVAGLVLGLYLALALRALVFDPKPVLWGLLWDHETDWLPFLVLLLLLVFSRNRLYAQRELREGAGRIVPSVFLVAVLALIFAVGTGDEQRTPDVQPEGGELLAGADGEDQREDRDEEDRRDDAPGALPQLALRVQPVAREDEEEQQDEERQPVRLVIPQEPPEHRLRVEDERAQSEREVEAQHEAGDVEHRERQDARAAADERAQRAAREQEGPSGADVLDDVRVVVESGHRRILRFPEGDPAADARAGDPDDHARERLRVP